MTPDRAHRIRSMFRSGMDTLQIAERFGIDEALACRLLTLARDEEIGQRTPREFIKRTTLRRPYSIVRSA